MTRDIKPLCLLALLSVSLQLVFNITCSPFGQTPNFLDANIFQIVGRVWADGGLPYVDAWDHKGPLIFLINALSYRLTDGSLGAFAIQCVGWTVFAFFGYKILRLRFRSRTAFLLAVACLVARLAISTEGNHISDYIMPLTTVAYYMMSRWSLRIQSRCDCRHNPGWALWYGVVAGVALMMRPIDMVAVVGPALVIGVVVAAHGLWRNLMVNVTCFIGGTALVVLPSAAYFYSKGALSDMMFATFEYNFIYLNKSLSLCSELWLPRYIAYFYPAFFCVFVSVWLVIRNPSMRLQAILWLAPASLLSVWYVTGNAYWHYSLVGLPLLYPAFAEFADLRVSGRLKAIVAAGLSVVVGVGLFSNVRMVVNNRLLSIADTKEEYLLLKHVPVEELDSVQILTTNLWPIVKHDMPLKSSIFFNYDKFSSHSERLRLRVLMETEAAAPRWIIGHADCLDTYIRENYELVDKRAGCPLYRRNDHPVDFIKKD